MEPGPRAPFAISGNFGGVLLSSGAYFRRMTSFLFSDRSFSIEVALVVSSVRVPLYTTAKVIVVPRGSTSVSPSPFVLYHCSYSAVESRTSTSAEGAGLPCLVQDLYSRPV